MKDHLSANPPDAQLSETYLLPYYWAYKTTDYLTDLKGSFEVKDHFTKNVFITQNYFSI